MRHDFRRHRRRVLLKRYEKKVREANTMAEITEIIVEQTIEMDDWPGKSQQDNS